MMTIHFAADLRPVIGEMTGMLYWIMDPAARYVRISHDHPKSMFTDHESIFFHNEPTEASSLDMTLVGIKY